MAWKVALRYAWNMAGGGGLWLDVKDSFWLGIGDGLASLGRGLLASPSRWLWTVCREWLLAKF